MTVGDENDTNGRKWQHHPMVNVTQGRARSETEMLKKSGK